ncbi:MAM domain, meprin/A5/mu domain-containing protein [Ditylenchus destructor]|uniref:MAM domain, meprin/A5/mu domain-containing protein n=1 Tax=Ditylenchus destructor TaxID=166010 RepID=A0AAD4R091_9BILA|nr:MAM domain, meprin/A5/mu domain-containing protein [Ditylenchus destructor]
MEALQRLTNVARPDAVRQMLPPAPSSMGSVKSGIASAIQGATNTGTAAADGSPAGMLVSKILQVALGLFVTTAELPTLPPEMAINPSIGFDCDFSTACRWTSAGQTQDKWRIARGEPDALLWLAATGTMVLPSEPFSLIEIRGGMPPNMLTSDIIACQREPSLFSFTYWTIGSSDLEICLLDQYYRQFNCTGMLQSRVQPGKVALRIPAIKHPFHISIIPSSDQGILVIDDIKYDARYCGRPPPVVQPLPIFPTDSPLSQVTPHPTVPPGIQGPVTPYPYPTTQNPLPFVTPGLTWPTMAPLTMPTLPPAGVHNWMTTTSTTPFPFGQPFSLPSTTTPNNPFAITMPTPKVVTILPGPLGPFTLSTTTTTPTPFVTTSTLRVVTDAPPFDLLILGNKTSPLHDRRRGRIIDDTGDLLCDFANNFPCYWGPEAGRWAIIEKGAIPSLEEGIISHSELPSYPAAVVIQGTAMLTSDPVRCQSGDGKLLFRYWTNGRVLMQVCAMGYNLDSGKMLCVEEVAKSSSFDDTTLAVFNLSNPIKEPFTLNIVPVWERGSQNTYLVIDEIAYIGECNDTSRNDGIGPIGSGKNDSGENEDGEGTGEIGEPEGGSHEGEEKGSSSEVDKTGSGVTIDPKTHITYTEKGPKKSHTASTAGRRPATTPRPIISLPNGIYPKHGKTIRPPPLTIDPRQRPFTTTTLIPPSSTWKPGTRYPFLPTTPTFRPPKSGPDDIVDRPPPPDSIPLPPAVTTVYPKAGARARTETTKGSYAITYTTTPRYATTTTEAPMDYCKLLNCDFNDNACHYLNHGLTKVPWTLRTKAYGFPLARHTDLKPTPANGQFVSCVLGPGDFAILESPKFNLTQGINVLLFQYYRPTHSSTIRLCMGTRYSKPLRTVSSFLQCPPILRSLTSKNAFKWNSVHIQLPPGTSNFYLVAHNLDRSSEKAAIAIDNIRVAICDPRSFDPPVDENVPIDHSEEIYQDEK